MSRTLLKIVMVFGALTLAGCSQSDSASKSIRLAHGLPVNHPVHVALVYFKDQVESLSEGTLSVEIFPSGQLGTEREIVELIQMGTLGMTKVSASSLEAFIPQMKVFGLPYLFTDAEHYWNVLQGDVGKELLAEGSKYRVKGLGYFDAGSRSFYTTQKPIAKPDDLLGLKIRVMNSQSAVNMVNTMGGSATPVSWGELYTALQQGIVDGAENNPPSFYFSKHFEVSKYYILDEHTSIPDVIIVGTHLWSSLNAEQHGWLKEAMARATEFQRELWQQSTEESLAAVKAAGVEVVSADKRVFQDSVAALYQQIEDPALIELVKQIREVN
jgi:tripartite ATP-independent transporter DctP family solute receptor